MTHASRVHILQLVAAGLLLACAPLGQLAEFGSDSAAVATSVAIVDAGDFSTLTAYQKLDQLPGYRLQADQLTARNGLEITSTIISQVDAGGNNHTVTQTADGVLHESYVINGQPYLFNTQYNGWVAGSAAGSTLNGPHRWLLQLGVVPVETGRETVEARSVTRYRLNYLLPKLAEGQAQANSPKISGSIWVDEATGALLKSEIQMVEADQTRQKFSLTVTEIGSIDPIVPPVPIVDPDSIVAATATAQAWTRLTVRLNYQGERIEFDLIPLHVKQNGDDSPVEMQLLLRNLPPDILVSPEADPFLTQLGAQLTLSIPQNNLTAGSVGHQVESSDPVKQSVTVNYRFNASLGDFSHVELLLTNAGNPIIAPVPVN
jgi:hypothetical protein